MHQDIITAKLEKKIIIGIYFWIYLHFFNVKKWNFIVKATFLTNKNENQTT